MVDGTPNKRRMTTDPGRIREWAEARGAVPILTQRGEGHGYSFIRRDALTDEHTEYTWDEFTEAFANEDLVFVYHQGETATEQERLGFFEFVDRDRAFTRVDLGRDEFEDSLRRGETVTTEVVETQVIEREIIERDLIESKVIEADVGEREIIGSQVVDRDIVNIEFTDGERIEVIVDETRLNTIEEIERYTVESRVIDVNIEQHEDLERDEIETDVALESVQRSLLESDVVHPDVMPDEVIEGEVIQSKRTEGDVVQSELLEQRTIEEETEERRRLRFTPEEAELISSTVVGTEVVDGELIDLEEYATAEITADEGGEPDRDTVKTESMAAAESESSRTPTGEVEIELSADDQGKVVVDERGQQVGVVVDVEEQTAYIEPQPGLAGRLKARLNWGGHSDDSYPLEPSQIMAVRDDTVVIRSK